MIVKVKICGIRNLESAQAAIEAGADFLGFNFVVESKRFIEPAAAKKIISEVKGKGKGKIVGVFKNADINYINRLIDLLDFDFIQLQEKKIIKSIRNQVIFLLIDRKKQGQGKMVNLYKAQLLAQKFPVFLAGGLTPDNVSEIVNKVKPYAVDVASGIETGGFQDINKIKTFTQNAKGVFI